MALVDYSDSDSEPETTVQPTSAPAPAPAPKAAASATGAKKPFQKVTDRSKPGKILVNLPQLSARDESATAADDSGPPPAKRARIGGGGGGGGAFSGFNSFLPPPKNTGKPTVASSSGKSAPRPGVNLKTGAVPGFSRELDNESYDEVGAKVGSSESKQQQQHQQPSIPAGQKPAEEVELVGKPMMFKPLSVSRRPAKKNANKAATGSRTTSTPSTSSTVTTAAATMTTSEARTTTTLAKQDPPKKKISLFSISDEPDEEDTVPDTTQDRTYEPMFSNGDDMTTEEAFAQYDAQFANLATPQTTTTTTTTASSFSAQSDSLDAIASDMNLSAAARRELFGRRGAPDAAATAAKVISFNTDREYAHNEALRAAGEQQIYNPVRAVAPGKHNLRQLVNQVHNQREALEESFAKGKSNQKEASARYGWR